MTNNLPYDRTTLAVKAPAASEKHKELLRTKGFKDLLKLLGVRVQEQIVVLVTGGIDSTTVLYGLLHEKREMDVPDYLNTVYPLQILREGMPEIEKIKVEDICNALGIQCARMNYPTGEEETYMGYIDIATKYAKQVRASKILVGQVFTDRFGRNGVDTDSSLAANRVAKKKYKSKLPGNNIIGVVSPFGYIPKAEVIGFGRRIGVPLEMTVSCPYRTKDRGPCGTCPQCLDRQKYL